MWLEFDINCPARSIEFARINLSRSLTSRSSDITVKDVARLIRTALRAANQEPSNNCFHSLLGINSILSTLSFQLWPFKLSLLFSKCLHPIIFIN